MTTVAQSETRRSLRFGQFSLRGLLITVAVLGTSLGLWKRWYDAWWEAKTHEHAAAIAMVNADLIVWFSSTTDDPCDSRGFGLANQATLIPFLQKYPSSQVDWLIAKGIETIDDETIGEMRFLPNLKIVDANTSAFGDQALASVSQANALRHLSIGSTAVTDQGVESLRNHPGLESVSLYDTNVTDASAAALASIPRLYALHIGKTRITDECLLQLSQCRRITSLSLDDTAISDAGVDALSRMKQLTHLNLSGTKISDEGFRKLQAKLPSTEIKR